MSLSNIDKKHADELILSINGGNNINHNSLEIVRKNYMQYGKLKFIAKQMEQLQREAMEIINEAYDQERLHATEFKGKKISGNTYHLYRKDDGTEYFSLIAPEEWTTNPPHEFLDSFLYDYDKTFVKC
jgi:serine phosphatase RsbU (regulator of sigma subunit)